MMHWSQAALDVATAQSFGIDDDEGDGDGTEGDGDEGDGDGTDADGNGTDGVGSEIPVPSLDDEGEGRMGRSLRSASA